jgi:hypothetical protein
MGKAASGVMGIFSNPKNFTGEQQEADKKKSKRRSKNAKTQKKRADDLTNAFGRTLLNNPLGKNTSLLQGRPGSAASSGSVLG